MAVQVRGGFLTALMASAVLAACSSTPVVAPVSAAASVPPAPAPKPSPPAAATPAPVARLAPYLDRQNPLYKERSVYFDFDQAAIKPAATSLIELHGKYLASHPSVAIKIEGNTDELGGAEYNLALGQKRAEAVSKALKIFGVKDAQMEAVSFGEEKPKALGHDEVAHAQNRRADLDYPAK
jgi:peptidoglycan-associated lipoprotein